MGGRMHNQQCSRLTPGGAGGLYAVPGIKAESLSCKASALPTIYLLGSGFRNFRNYFLLHLPHHIMTY